MYTTKKTLLERLQNSDNISWNEFYSVYFPLVCAIGRKLDMTQDDCKDLMQEIMFDLFKGKDILNYDSSKGKFRTYFGSIVRHKALKMLRDSARHSLFSNSAQEASNAAGAKPVVLSDIQNENDPFQKLFDEEYRNYLLNLALNELRNRVAPETYDIFEMVVLQGRSSKEVAKHLGISRSVISVYCSRCKRNLQKIVSDIRFENPEFNHELLI